MLYSILVAIDVLLAISIIGLVLIQQGKGASVGAAFGSGASGRFLVRVVPHLFNALTTALAALFFVNSLALAYLASHRPVAESVITTTSEIVEGVNTQTPQTDMNDTDFPDVPGNEAMESSPSAAYNADEAGNRNESLEDTPDDLPE